MTEKFTIEDLFIKIVPGGTLAGILYLVYGERLQWMPVEGMGILYTFRGCLNFPAEAILQLFLGPFFA